MATDSTTGGTAGQLDAADRGQARAAAARKAPHAVGQASAGTGHDSILTATTHLVAPSKTKPAAPLAVTALAATPAHSGATTVSQVQSTCDGPAAEQDSGVLRAARAAHEHGAGARCARDWTAAEVAARKPDPWQSVDPLTQLTRAAFLAMTRSDAYPMSASAQLDMQILLASISSMCLAPGSIGLCKQHSSGNWRKLTVA